MNYMKEENLWSPRHLMAKIRYGHQGEMCTISKNVDGSVACQFDKPVRAITPGQAVVFYEDGYVFGGGTIC